MALVGEKTLRANPHERPEKAAADALRLRLAAVWRALRRAAKPERPSAKRVHDLRVAARRADAALELFEEFLPAQRAERVRKDLARLRRSAGKARDLDVLLERLMRETAAPSDRPWLAGLQAERRRAQARIEAAYRRARRGHRFETRCEKLLRRLQRNTRGAPEEGGLEFRDWARGQLGPLVAEFFAAEPSSPEGEQDLHRFRIRGKRLRYALELVSAAFPAEWSAELYPLVSELQDRLGGINDLATAAARLPKLSKAVGPAGKEALRRLVAGQESRLQEARQEFLAWYFADAQRLLHEGFARELALEPAP